MGGGAERTLGSHRQNLQQMTTPFPTDQNVRESDLADVLRIDRAVLKKMRRPGRQLLPGADWVEVKGQGIFITPDGQKKIEAALPEGAEKDAATDPPAEETRDIEIKQLCLNKLVVAGVPEEGDSPSITVRLARGPSASYRPGMVLPGCVRLPQTGQWEYRGPKPRWHGRF